MKRVADILRNILDKSFHKSLPTAAITLVILIFLMAAIAWSEPLPSHKTTSTNQITMGTDAFSTEQTLLPTQPAQVPQATPTSNIPPEYIGNPHQTDGLVIGSSVLILVIIISTLSLLRGQSHSSKSRKISD